MNFTVFSPPVPQKRARVMRGGWAYDPPESKAAKKIVACYALKALSCHRDTILGADYAGRVSITLKFYGARATADLDNLYKLVTDACQGILYKNDCQIDHAEIHRHPAEKSQERTEVWVSSL